MNITINLSVIMVGLDDQGKPRNNAYQDVKNEFEPHLLRELLAYTNNNKTHAARIAGLHVSTFNRKLKQHGIVVEKQVRGRGNRS